MKRIIVVGIILTVASTAFALPHNKKTGINYIFSDKTNIRAQASSKSKVIATVPIGTKVEILQKTDVLFQYNNRIDYWYKVKINKKTVGYVWGGLLSNNFYFNDVNNDKKKELILIRNFSFGGYSLRKNAKGKKLITRVT